MESNRPDTTAWERVRDRVNATAAEYREHGDTVLEVFADHSAVRQPPDGPITFSYTVPDDTIAELQKHVRDSAPLHTDIQYVDVEQTRMYVLDVHDESAGVRVLIAGGVRHESIGEYTDEDGPARTVIRSATGMDPVEFQHDSVAPFFVGFD